MKRSIQCTLLLLLVGIVSRAQTLPDAPYMSATTVHNSPAIEREQKTSKFDYGFVLAHGAYAGALIFDDLETMKGVGHGCAEANSDLGPRPSAKQLAIHGFIEFAAVTAFDYFMKRSHVRALSYIGAGLGTVKHARGGYLWTQTGCF